MKQKLNYEKPTIELRQIDTAEHTLLATSAVAWDENRSVEVQKQEGETWGEHGDGTFTVTQWDDPTP